VMNNRVNGTRLLCSFFVSDARCQLLTIFILDHNLGVLAVTRALGDSSMKQFVVGSPYTTETTLGVDDEWLIVACDGVRSFFIFRSLTISSVT
jgi:hypothetical protein